jgi:hypothetical protein
VRAQISAPALSTNVTAGLVSKIVPASQAGHAGSVVFRSVNQNLGRWEELKSREKQGRNEVQQRVIMTPMESLRSRRSD